MLSRVSLDLRGSQVSPSIVGAVEDHHTGPVLLGVVAVVRLHPSTDVLPLELGLVVVRNDLNSHPRVPHGPEFGDIRFADHVRPINKDGVTLNS